LKIYFSNLNLEKVFKMESLNVLIKEVEKLLEEVQLPDCIFEDFIDRFDEMFVKYIEIRQLIQIQKRILKTF